jgi:hypothetical protein
MKNYRQCIQNWDSENSFLNLHPVHNTYLFTITVHKYVFMWIPATWIVPPCSSTGTDRHFKRKYRLHIQSRSGKQKTEEKLTLLSFRWKQQVPLTLLPNYMVLHPIRQEYSYSLPRKPQTSLVLISHLSLICLFNLLCIWELQIILISMMYRTILTCSSADTDYSVI